MSQVHKVIILNKPLKVFDFTPLQLILLLFSLIAALLIATKVPFPPDWKWNGLPAGAILGFLLFCLSLALVKMSEVKPWSWWQNMILYKLQLVKSEFLPRHEPGPIYPDPTIIEAKKKSETYLMEGR